MGKEVYFSVKFHVPDPRFEPLTFELLADLANQQMTNIKQIFATGFMILTKSNLYQQHAGNNKFTKLHIFLLHLFLFTEHTLIKLWQNSRK
jgi:hypothetical protein